MDRDYRYDASLVTWQRGKITVFSELFKWMPKTIVAKDMHVGLPRLNACIADPRRLTAEDIARLADLYRLPRSVIRKLIQAQVKATPVVPRPRRPQDGE